MAWSVIRPYDNEPYVIVSPSGRKLAWTYVGADADLLMVALNREIAIVTAARQLVAAHDDGLPEEEIAALERLFAAVKQLSELGL